MYTCNIMTIINFILIIVNCGHPSLLSPDSQSFAPRIEGYDNLPVQGSTVRFSCSPGSVLMGSNSATCSENGRWELDPNGLTCIESNGNHLL